MKQKSGPIFVTETDEPDPIGEPPTPLATCRACHEPVHKQATRCPKCGYQPNQKGHPTAAVLIGGLLTLTGVGALIGIPLIFLGLWAHRNRQDNKPHNTDPS